MMAGYSRTAGHIRNSNQQQASYTSLAGCNRTGSHYSLGYRSHHIGCSHIGYTQQVGWQHQHQVLLSGNREYHHPLQQLALVAWQEQVLQLE